MSLFLALGLWVALSFVVSPLIGALISRQVPACRRIGGAPDLAVGVEPGITTRAGMPARRAAIALPQRGHLSVNYPPRASRTRIH